MSNNFSNYDFLFKTEQGKKLTKEQLLENYQNLVKKDKGHSIFKSDISGMIGDIFEELNTQKLSEDDERNGEEEFLDETEINALRTLVDDKDDNSNVSAKDFKKLNDKIIEKISKKYSIDGTSNPENMYKQALKNANGDMRDSSYMLDLSNDINTLTSMKALRQLESENAISQYQSEIDKLIKDSKELSDKFKAEYEKTQKEAAAKQQQIKDAEAKIKANKQRIAQIKQKQANAKQHDSQNSDFKSTIDSLEKENIGLSLNIAKYTVDLKEKQDAMLKMQEEAQSEDNSLKNNIYILKTKIEEEESSCKNDINNYDVQIKALKKAINYAKPRVFRASNNTLEYNLASHQNDNAISFGELEKQGLKYSSSKGQALASDVYSHRVGFTGYCSRYVKNALRRTGLANLGSCNGEGVDNAMRASGNKNFVEVKITSREQLRSLPAGCVVVYEKGAAGYNAKYGHVEVTRGNGTAVSDGVTRNMRYSENMSVFVPVEPKGA